MSFLLTFFVVLATMVAVAMFSVRKFFLTNGAAGYVFVAFNWSLLILASVVFALLIKWIESSLAA